MTRLREINRASNMLRSKSSNDIDIAIDIIEKYAIEFGMQYCHCESINEWSELCNRIQLTIEYEHCT